MRIAPFLLLASLTGALAPGATVIPGDARRGEELFKTESCIQCHSINGRGGDVGPDLGRQIDRNFNPAMLAGLMWNHAPQMWATMEKRGVTPPKLSDEAAADLFAYFFSTRFFERPGDAARGKDLFSARHCSGCHAIAEGGGPGKPVKQWQSLADPIVLVQQMWDHSAGMRDAFRAKKIAWQPLTSQDLTDMQVYLRNLPETRGTAENLQLAPGGNGAALFESKGCAKCHVGKLDLTGRLKNATLTDIAVDMWNHAPKMTPNPPVLDRDEMRQIVTFIWARQFFQHGGNSVRGKNVFTAKKCVTCHGDPSSARSAWPCPWC